ncbi:MAG TPA: hypothetical protein PLJ12_16720, partial [Planctomycetota bacterium]|nr:hypothetical protein [Planctomycetota bacterium]
MERALDEGDLAPNPDALLTVVQAAQWAGVPLSTIRKLMDEGLLRFEVLRQGEREVQRIRMVDLRERFPSEASHSTPTPKSGSAASSSGESGSPAANAATVGAAEPADTRLGPRGFERGLALLSQQQEELREQCFDLRRRLTHTELERQRAMEALIRAQERFQPGALDPPQAWWKRPAWLAAAVAGLALVGWVGRSFQVLHAAVDQSASQWSTQARSYTDEQLAFQVRRSDGERRALAEKLERWEQDRQRLVQLQTEQAAILLEQRQALESALGGVAGQTQEVTEALAKALEEQKQWA